MFLVQLLEVFPDFVVVVVFVVVLDAVSSFVGLVAFLLVAADSPAISSSLHDDSHNTVNSHTCC